MTEYFVLDWDAAVNIVGHVDDKNTQSLANKYTRGQLLDPTEQPVDLVVQVELGPDVYPDFFTLQQTPIASERFVVALRSLAPNFQAFPTQIVEPERTIAGYYVLNIVGRVAALDEQATIATFVRNRMFRVKKLALDLSKIQDFDLCRLHQFPLPVLVSASVRDVLQEGYSGVSLMPAQGWSDSVWF